VPEQPWDCYRSAIDDFVGLRITSVEDAEVRASFDMRPELTGLVSIIHGGVYAAIAESMAGVATMTAVAPLGMGTAGMSNAASFLRPISEGHVEVVARRRHRGRTTWIWDVEFLDEAERVCALVRLTLAVRPSGPEVGLRLDPHPR
jgi:uncharacterized protein (TIGR00369 family)